ncbi:hypothetical protein [Comamonas testosteroni]|nr:hypothetical protein [Comamonas testosteroni]
MQAHAQRLLQLDRELEEKTLQVQQREQQIEQLSHASAKAQQRAQEQERLLAAKATELQSTGQENQLLLKQLHKVQEELESRYLQAMQQEKALAELHKVKTDLKAAQEKTTALQAVGREKQTLQEQLQKVQEELASRKAKAQQEEKTLAELPKVKAELKVAQDKTVQLQQSEARLKTQLQAQSAKASTAADLEKENELLLTQLHKVQEELERHYLESSKLKDELKPQPSALFGAADRVKQQLSYRLGSTMIRQSRSIGGWLNMPFALSAETKRFRQDQAAGKDQQLPPIAQYRDAHEAELIKQHLSYRLGARLLSNTKTLGGRISLPWSLYAEVMAFRKDRQSH